MKVIDGCRAVAAAVVFVIFAGSATGWVRWLLVSAPLQRIGLASYSLCLWQQVFLASPDLYAGAPLPIVLLPVAVVASVFLMERPFVRLGQRWSSAIYDWPAALHGRQAESA